MGFFDIFQDQVELYCKKLQLKNSETEIIIALNFLEETHDHRAADCIFNFMIKASSEIFNKNNRSIGYDSLHLVNKSAKILTMLETKDLLYNRISQIKDDAFYSEYVKCAFYEEIQDDYAKQQLLKLFILYSRKMDYSSTMIHNPTMYLLEKIKQGLLKFGDAIIDDLLPLLKSDNKNLIYQVIWVLGETKNKKIFKPLSELNKSDVMINERVTFAIKGLKK